MSTVFRVQKNKGYTVMSNYHLFDEQLSAKATTYLSIMLALPPTWDYTLAGLTTFKKGGLSSVRAAINELEEQGYLSRRQLRDEHGRLSNNEYIVYETPEMNPDYKKKKINKPKKKKSASKLENTQFSPSCDFPLTENPLSEKPLSENRTQSITNQSNTKISITNQSVCHRAENEKSNIDRLTDRPHQKSFSEILDEINYRSRFMPESENDCSEPDAESVKRCSVPYEFRDDKKTMKRALMFLFGFNYYSDGMNEQDKELFLQVITLIAEIAVSDNKLGGRTVKYHEVISRLNELIANNMLYDWFLSFIPEWNTICQERKIKNVRAYLKACIWSWLNEYEIIENSLSRSIPEVVYSSSTSEAQGNAYVSDFCTDIKEIAPSNKKSCHEPVRPNRNDFEKTKEIIESSISKNIPEKVCSSDTYETQRDDFPDEEADYFFRHGKTEDDMTDMFLKPSVPFEEKVAWLDEFVENWRNSEQHFIFSNVRFEFEKRNSHV